MPKARYVKKTVKPRRKTPKRTHVTSYYRGIKMAAGSTTGGIRKAVRNVLEVDINPFRQKRRGH